MKKWMFLPVGLGLFFTACATYSVRYDYEARADYSTFKTFDWYASSRLGKDQERKVDDPIMDRRVAAAVERELTARGFRRETAADPDFLVTYYPVYRDMKYQTAQEIGFGGWGFRPFGVGISTVTSQEHRYKEGTLVLEIMDFRTNQRVWQAAAEGALTDLRTPQDADRQVSSAVHQMLERFPPRNP
jgi:hypothetical protein